MKYVLPSSEDLGWTQQPFLLLRTLPSFLLILLPSLLLSLKHSVSMVSSSTRIMGMFSFKAGDGRPTSAFLLFRRGLMEGVGDGVSRGGLGGYWDPGSLKVIGDTLFPFGLGDLWSGLLSIFVSLFESATRSLSISPDFWDVATSASLLAAGELCRVSLCAKTRELLCNTGKCGINIQVV